MSVKLGYEAIEFAIRKWMTKNTKGIASIPGQAMKDKIKILVDKYAKQISMSGKDVNKVTVKQVDNAIDYGMALKKQQTKKASEDLTRWFDKTVGSPPKKEPTVESLLKGKEYIDERGRSWVFPPGTKKKDLPEWTKGWTPKIVPKDDFASGGIARVGLKNGKGVDLDRRMVLKGIGALAALPVVGKFFKWAKPLAKRDIRVKMKTDMDWSYEGPESGWEGGTWLDLDFVPLTKKGTKILDDLAKNKKIGKSIHDKETYYYTAGNSEDGLMAVEDIKKMKGDMELETSVHDKVKGSMKGEYETTKVYSGKDIDSKKILRETSDLATDSPYHDNVFQDEFTEEIINTIKKEKMASGGIAGELHLYDGGRAGFKEGSWSKLKKKYKGSTLQAMLDNPQLMAAELGHEGVFSLLQMLGMKEGGRAGFDKGKKVDLSKRRFLKGTGATLGVLSALPFVGKFFKAAKTAAPAAEKIATVAGGIPEYASRLIEVVKNKGIMEIIEGLYKRNPPSKKYTYKGVEVTEDGLGTTSVRKEQTKTGSWTDQASDKTIVDDYVDREIGFEIRKGETVTNKKGKQIQTPDEYTESTAKMQGDPEGGMDVSEVLEYIDEADHLELKKIADESLIKKASGGRASYTKGGLAHVLGV